MRIALSGSAGTGKTTLATRLAEELGVPYIEESMRKLIREGLDMHELTIEGHRDLMGKLWRAQAEQEAAAGSGFVADRSSLDYAAFWMHYELYEDREASAAWMEAMRAHAESYDRIVLLPHGSLPLEDDGVRSTNPWVQLRYQGIVEVCLRRWYDPARLIEVPDTTDFDERLAFVRAKLR